MCFDLCFNTPIAKYQNRIIKQVVAKLSDHKIAYALLLQAYDKLENYSTSKKFDPVLEALYAANLISSLEREDYADSEMQNLFSFYADSYMLVSVNSSIIEDVIHFQQLKVDYDVYSVGETQYAKLKYLYFDMGTKLD